MIQSFHSSLGPTPLDKNDLIDTFFEIHLLGLINDRMDQLTWVTIKADGSSSSNDEE